MQMAQLLHMKDRLWGKPWEQYMLGESSRTTSQDKPRLYAVMFLKIWYDSGAFLGRVRVDQASYASVVMAAFVIGMGMLIAAEPCWPAGATVEEGIGS